MTNKLIVFSAPSGAGKTTLVKYILKTFSEIEFRILEHVFKYQNLSEKIEILKSRKSIQSR